MHVVFTYSLLEEAKTCFDLLFQYKQNKELHSVVFPSIKALLNRDSEVQLYADIWKNIEPDFNQAIISAGLVPLETDVICFTHKFGCEGCFNIDKNQIHVRTTKSTKSNTVESIIHELLHLLTYKPGMSFQEREDLVDKYLALPTFRQLISTVPSA